MGFLRAATLMVSVLLVSSPVMADHAGQQCLDSAQLLTAFPDPVRVKPYVSKKYTIIKIDKVVANQSDTDSLKVIGFLYVLENGKQYYGPRKRQMYSRSLFITQFNFLLRIFSGKEPSKTVRATANQVAETGGGIAYISVKTKKLRSALNAELLSLSPCLSWPKGRSVIQRY